MPRPDLVVLGNEPESVDTHTNSQIQSHTHTATCLSWMVLSLSQPGGHRVDRPYRTLALITLFKERNSVFMAI